MVLEITAPRLSAERRSLEHHQAGTWLTVNAELNPWSSVGLALRSLLWTILLPGFFAGYVPWRYFGLGRAELRVFSPASILGVSCIGLGAVLLAACIVEFARTGRGTLSPVDPPRRLVVRGLYRYVRNPMYLSVTTIVLGEWLVTRSSALGFYWAVWFVGVNLFVIGYEEPTLHRLFGASYDEYTKQVGRWLPKPGSRSNQ
jgi:protein-S-isoprenylcysteine O-methyltransferase Ste14